jgi:hypothetical protein
MKRERWLILTFLPALLLLNAFVVLNYTGLAYQPFSWKAFAGAYPPGTACTDPSECSPAFCVDRVCCAEACTGPNESCDQQGREGECLPIVAAPAPALSGTGLLIAALLLAAVGTIGMIRNRRENG